MLEYLKNKILNYLFIKNDIFKYKKNNFKLNSLKTEFKNIGKGFYIEEVYKIYGMKYISIGNNFIAGNRFWLDAISIYKKQNFSPEIKIEDNVHIMNNVHIGCINSIYIGSGTLIASNVLISDHSHGNIHSNESNIPPKDRPLVSKGKIVIGKNVWIGEFVTILGNVEIGDYSIIGANSVVNKSFPKNSVIAGNPAKIIKQL